MSEYVRELINAIESGSAVETEGAFQAAMAEKISVRLDTMRQEVAANMFKSEAVDASVEEATDAE